ncbi:hypothetical protein BV22DRAFT_1052335 [Leucogyrophana mollusca]|uniref:Uncharacterized protein n=1 Tax=Leucogyrophana mollusca TaxID=85980 RepID=A0ACB8AW13_9AGAM|nr:hypothetical protein BV22DRAFT_1052335 [Leucogyrophana mollusca]
MARLSLEAVCAKRKVRHAEKHLAKFVLQEHVILTSLYCVKAEVAEKRLEVAEMGVGRVRMQIRNEGLPLVHSSSSPSRRHRHSATSSVSQCVELDIQSAQKLEQN